MADNPNKQLGGTAIKPVGWDRSGFEAFRYFIYDPATGAILSRTPMSWAKITGFYCIYYTLLAAFWLTSLQIFFLTIDDNVPKWTLNESIIGSNPGVGMKPTMSDKHIDSSLFIFYSSDSKTTPSNPIGEGERNADIAKRMDLFLSKYSDTRGLFECPDGNNDRNKGKCQFDISSLGECGSSPYGYIPEDETMKPCLFIKLNKIFGFNPEPIDATNLDDPMFESMTSELKEKIRATEDKEQVFFDCFGRFPGDKEAATLKFFPESQSVSLKHFPYKGGNYQSPMMAVQIDVPKNMNNRNQGQMIHIECRAWYKGVKHDKKDKAGLTQFEVIIN
jgi:sodium/potassium-transporting ATPase subunit beta